ncbi:hypothetical protein ACFV5G_10500 [Streptomyces sp. NPDC059766]|uniref:hypothetical protein n=1 Tax=Streptomyces sp. NPDC059766 TaxID=3346940 RepID=UPI00365711FD
MSSDDAGDARMAWFIKRYDALEDPELRAELLMCHGIHPEVLASWRRRLARIDKFTPTEQVTTRSTCSVPWYPRSTRRRSTRGPRTYPTAPAGRRIRCYTGRTVVTTVTTTKSTDTGMVTTTVITITTPSDG